MVLLLFNIDASAGHLLGKLTFLPGGKDGCVICEGDVSEEPGRRSRSELVPGIGLWEGEQRSGKDFVRAGLLPGLLPRGGTGSGPHINSVKAGFWSASLVVKPKQKDEPSVATAWGSFVSL